MRSFAAFIITAVSAGTLVSSLGLPNTQNAFQIQPTFQGAFPRTPCITVMDAANGSAAFINDCSQATQRRGFTFTQPPGTLGQIRVFNNFCLQANQTNNGAKVFVNTCQDGNAQQTWNWGTDGVVLWGGFLKMCLDLTNGVLENGNQLQIWECTSIVEGHSNTNQIWSANTLQNPVNEVSLAGRDICMTAVDSANGSPVFGQPCDSTTGRKVWFVPQPGHGNTGSIRMAFGPDGSAPFKCLDVTDGVDNNGTKLQLWDCTSGPNQQWFPTGAEIRWDGVSLLDAKCIDLTDGVSGNQLQIWDCVNGPNANQGWSGVPPPQAVL